MDWVNHVHWSRSYVLDVFVIFVLYVFFIYILHSYDNDYVNSGMLSFECP